MRTIQFTKTLDGVTYVIDHAALVRPGDWFIVDNPHRGSALKDKVYRCAYTRNDEHMSVQPESDDLVLTEWPQTWCTKITGVVDNASLRAIDSTPSHINYQLK